MCQNIKRSRASLTPAQMNLYFDELTTTLDGVPNSNLVSYDETNLTDDLGVKRVIVRGGSKHAERNINSTKSSTSIMFAGSAIGELLPPYVVYKANHFYDTWTLGGPKGARYNRSKSGWFDIVCFTDWFFKIALPYFRRLEGKKVLIGDNLSSHISIEVITECENNDIHFILLPPNSTHLCHPLDVAFFRPLKSSWRSILEEWKLGPGRKQASVAKDTFPNLLAQLMNRLDGNREHNLKSGFSKCGIVPLNRDKVLKNLPTEQATGHSASVNEAVEESLVSLFKEMRYEVPERQPRKKKLKVAAGKSVAAADLFPSEDEDITEMEPFPDPPSIEESSDGVADEEAENPNQCKIATVAPMSGTQPRHVDESQVLVNMWLVVDFSASNKGQREKNLYLGRVENILRNRTYEGVFLRETFKGNGTTFSYPMKEDREQFQHNQILGEVENPSEMRRGVLKFEVNFKNLANF